MSEQGIGEGLSIHRQLEAGRQSVTEGPLEKSVVLYSKRASVR
jgi:hypothetical protein